MDTRLALYGALAIGTAAFGGVYLLIGGDDVADDLAVAELYTQVPEQSSSVPSHEPVEAKGIEQQGASAALSRLQIDGVRGEFNQADFAARLALFDVDGDGFISDEERQAMRDSMLKARLARLDADGDGKVSREERQAARWERFENSERGQVLLRQYDANGDGVLDEHEQASLDLYNQQQRQQRLDQQLAQYDADGDGQLSSDERDQQRADRIAQWELMRDETTKEFDADGDGRLNIEEQQNAVVAWMERRAIDQFISRYDSDGNGQVDAGDYAVFAQAYGSRDTSADVNSDGVVNTLDLTAYTDLVTRSNNRP